MNKEKLKVEIELAKKLNREYLLPKLKAWYKRYIGEYKPEIGEDFTIILNEIYPIIQWQIPSIFFRNPKAYVKPRKKTHEVIKKDPITGMEIPVQIDVNKSAKTQENLINFTYKDIKYKKYVRSVLSDALIFNFGVLWHGYKGDFGVNEEGSLTIKKEKVFVSRISPMDFIFDPKVNLNNLESAEWSGRILRRPKEEVYSDKKYKIPKTVNKKSENGLKYEDMTGFELKLSDEDVKKLGETVELQEIYYREDGEWRILVYCEGIEEPIRDDKWDCICDSFPSKILQFNELNESRYPLGDIETYKDIADQKNAIVNLQIRNAGQNANNIVVISKTGTDESEIDDIKEGRGNILTIEDDGDVRQKVSSITTGGGASSELYMLDTRIQTNLDEKSGVSDIKKGTLRSGEESATSVKYRMAGGNLRTSDRQEKMGEFLQESTEYLLGLIKKFMPYKDAVRIVGATDIEWSENFTQDDISAPTDVEIDIFSMIPEDPQQELAVFNNMLGMLSNMLLNPQMNAKILQEGKKINISPLIEQILYRNKVTVNGVFETLKPQDTQGYASVEQIKEAQANVASVLTGQNIPFPPQETDDHRAKLEIYGLVDAIMTAMGQQNEAIQQLIQAHSQVQQVQLSNAQTTSTGGE
jgi:hypothetical protein